MTFKSPTQPLCRYCGKPIKKRTETVWVEHPKDKGKFGTIVKRVYARLTTKDQCQQHTNYHVVSVQYGEDDDGRCVRRFSTWDGETYEDEFFCNGTHAQYFAYACARWENGRLAMPAYNEAVKNRK